MELQNDEIEIDLLDLCKYFLSKWNLILLGILVCAGIGCGYAKVRGYFVCLRILHTPSLFQLSVPYCILYKFPDNLPVSLLYLPLMYFYILQYYFLQ